MLLQVHDELIFETAEGEVESAIPVIREVMENAAMPARRAVGAAACRRARRQQLGRGALNVSLERQGYAAIAAHLPQVPRNSITAFLATKPVEPTH